MTLSGANSYSGGTTFGGGGGLAVGANTALGSGALTVNGLGGTLSASVPGVTLANAVILNGAGLTIGGGASLGLGGVIGGSGGLTLAGTGTLTLAGANNYTGGTTVNSGTLAIGAGGSLAAGGAVSLAGAGAVFDLSAANAVQTIGTLSGVAGSQIALGGTSLTVGGGGSSDFAGTIGGTGGLTLGGGGALTLTGANSYTGGTRVNSGTLAIGAGGSLAAGGAVDLAGPTAIFDVSTASSPQSIGTLSGVAGSQITLGGTSLALNENGSSSFAGAISGTGGLTLNGTGTLTLAGASSYSGPTTINGGTLAVTGAIGNSIVAVNNGAMLTGTGSVGGLVAAAGSTVAALTPGQALSINGDATLQPGSTLQIAINPVQRASLAVAGSAQIGGATLTLVSAPGQYRLGTTYTVLNATGGVQGQFGAVNSTFVFVDPSLTYGSTYVSATLERNSMPFASIAATPNQAAAAVAIDRLGVSNPIVGVIAVSDVQTARSGFSQLAGQLHASVSSSLLSDSHYLRDAVLERARTGAAGGSGPLGALSAAGNILCQNADPVAAGEGAIRHCASDSPYQPVVWGQVLGGWGKLRGDGNASSLHRDLQGMIAGVDVAPSDEVRLGIAGGYTHSGFDIADRNGTGSIDSYHIAAYGAGQFGGFGVRGGVAYSLYRIHGDRTVAFADFRDRLRSGYDASGTQVFGEIGYGIPVGKAAVEPFAGIAYVALRTNGFHERGGAAALVGNANRARVGFSTLGLRGAVELGDAAGFDLRIYATAGWRHAFDDVRPVAALAFVGGDGSRFQTAGVPIARNTAFVEPGVDMTIARHLSLGVSYRGQFGDGARDNAVLGNIRWRFGGATRRAPETGVRATDAMPVLSPPVPAPAPAVTPAAAPVPVVVPALAPQAEAVAPAQRTRAKRLVPRKPRHAIKGEMGALDRSVPMVIRASARAGE